MATILNGNEDEQYDAQQLLDWIKEGWYDSNLATINEALNQRAKTIESTETVGERPVFDLFSPLTRTEFDLTSDYKVNVGPRSRSKYHGMIVRIIKVNTVRVKCRKVEPDGTLSAIIAVPKSMLVKIAPPATPTNTTKSTPAKRGRAKAKK